MKTGLPYGVVNTNSQKRCLFCGTGLPNAQQSIEQHVKSKRHKENITLMTEHGIYYHNDALYCKPCKCHLGTEESVGRHIEAGDHSTWMAAIDEITDGEFVSLDSFLSTETDQEAQCEACHIAIDCSLSAIEEHVNSSSHRINVTEKLKPLNGIFRVENEEELWCKVCDVYIDNSVQGIFDHIDEDKHHTDWFSYMDDLLEYEDITIGDYLANEHEICAFCSKCQSDVPCDFQSIEDHIESDEHVRQYITEG